MQIRRSLTLALISFFSVATLTARAQVAPAAQSSGFSLAAGAEGSIFQPDYAGLGIAQTSPNRLYGLGVYVDARFTRWVQPEAEARWLRFNEYQGIGQNSYLIGPRVPIHDFHGLTPYAKVLVGWGSGTSNWLSGRAFAVAYGGGVDYRLTRRIKVRGDFEYENWHTRPTLWPYGGSVGVSYTIF